MIWLTWRQFRTQAIAGLLAGGPPAGCKEWLATQNLQHQVVYFGQEKFWVLQWRELGVLLAASALVAAFSFWWIRRRLV
jgi:hypothetical protein